MPHLISSPMRLAIVIPVFNEKKNIGRVMTEVGALIYSHPKWQILPIVVNDGSTDGTQQLLEGLSSRFVFQTIRLPSNLGIGSAVQTGMRRAEEWGAEICVQMDGDGQHPAEQIPLLVDPIVSGKYDIAVGSRYIFGGGGNVSTMPRQWGTRLFSLLLWMLVGIKIRDVTSGFRAFNRRSAHFLTQILVGDYPEVEAYVPLVRKKFRIVEVPVFMRARGAGVSSINGIRSIDYVIKVAFNTLMNALRSRPSSGECDSGK